MKRYSIDVEGVGAAEFIAETASKARMKAFRAVRDAGYRMTFREFLGRCYTLHLGRAPDVDPRTPEYGVAF